MKNKAIKLFGIISAVVLLLIVLIPLTEAAVEKPPASQPIKKTVKTIIKLVLNDKDQYGEQWFCKIIFTDKSFTFDMVWFPYPFPVC